MTDPRTVHVLYENPDWLPPLVHGLEEEGLPYRLQEVWHGLVDLDAPPEPGVYLNRMSPSSHTRGHDESCALMREALFWLEDHGRRVVNGSRAFDLEVSKVRQHRVLTRYGLLNPRTVLTVGRDALVAAAGLLDPPFLTKHNQGGKGLGIRLFSSRDELIAYAHSPDFDPGPMHQVLLQQYVRPALPRITRVEIVGGRFLFAMHSSTAGGFELCPADACQTPPDAPDVCPADAAPSTAAGAPKFSLAPMAPDDPIVRRYIDLCAREGLEVAGIEFVEDEEGRRWTYDINANTNYSSPVCREAGIDGMREVARYVGRLARGAGAARVA